MDGEGGTLKIMKIYETEEAIKADIKDGVLAVDEDVKFECSFSIEAKLKIAGDITARNITARNIRFYALCFAYLSFKCESIVGRRENAKYGCLDSEVLIENETKV